MLESIRLCEGIVGKKMKTKYVKTNRIGDHIWWISDISKFSTHYPGWKLTKNIKGILVESYEYNKSHWSVEQL
jgi:CDP-paratose 2-epimerase